MAPNKYIIKICFMKNLIAPVYTLIIYNTIILVFFIFLYLVKQLDLIRYSTVLKLHLFLGTE